MARRIAGGRPFVSTQAVAFGVTNFDTLQSGQWIQVAGHKKAVRFVRERQTGETFIVTAPRNGRLSMAAFRLACGVPNPKVIQTVKD